MYHVDITPRATRNIGQQQLKKVKNVLFWRIPSHNGHSKNIVRHYTNQYRIRTSLRRGAVDDAEVDVDVDADADADPVPDAVLDADVNRSASIVLALRANASLLCRPSSHSSTHAPSDAPKSAATPRFITTISRDFHVTSLRWRPRRRSMCWPTLTRATSTATFGSRCAHCAAQSGFC